MQTLEEFIEDWNATHSHFKFALNGVSTIRLNVEIRCSTTIYQKFLTAENWDRLSRATQSLTRGNMYLMDCGIDYFEHGCMYAVINSVNDNYNERMIVATLRWLGKNIIPQN